MCDFVRSLAKKHPDKFMVLVDYGNNHSRLRLDTLTIMRAMIVHEDKVLDLIDLAKGIRLEGGGDFRQVPSYRAIEIYLPSSVMMVVDRLLEKIIDE